MLAQASIHFPDKTHNGVGRRLRKGGCWPAPAWPV